MRWVDPVNGNTNKSRNPNNLQGFGFTA